MSRKVESKSSGLILRKLKYGEKDLIFDLLNESGQKMAFFLRGVYGSNKGKTGLLQIGNFVEITFTEGKSFAYPKEITLIPDYSYTLFAKSVEGIYLFNDLIKITNKVIQDFEGDELFEIVRQVYEKTERNIYIKEIYLEMLQGFMEIIEHTYASDNEVQNFNLLNEKEVYYYPEANKVFLQSPKVLGSKVEMVKIDVNFQIKFLQKKLNEIFNGKINYMYKF